MKNDAKHKRLLTAAAATVIALGALFAFCGCAARRTEDKMDTGYKVKRLTLGGIDAGEFTVVYGEESGDSATTDNIVADLEKYIADATGTQLRAVPDGSPEAAAAKHRIIVGKTRFDTDKVKEAQAKLTNNGYAILFDGSDLYLTGDTVTGAMYAVYSFLEDYIGWRFYSSKYETVKPAANIDVPASLNVSFSPKLLNRDTYWYDTFDNHFAAKLKLNGGVNRSMAGYGEAIHYAGPFVHSLPTLAGTSHAPDVQPCLTDPEVYARVLEGVRTYLRDNPDAKIVSVSQNDSYPEGRGCQCENCRRLDDQEGTPMGSLLTFVNRIAADIKDEFPDVLVDTLAYRYTRKAPKHLKPADNVIIRLCSIECCFSHPLGGSCERNREFAEDLEAWSKICDNLFIWDYTTDFLFYVNPFPNLYVLYDDVRFFVDHHAIGLFEQGNYQAYSGEFGELRAYLLAKLLWDPDMSRDEYFAYMDDFLEGYYGAGWKHIRKYIDLTSKLAAKGDMGIYYGIDKIFGVEKHSDDAKKLIETLGGLWDAALEAADEEHFPNVEKSSLQIRSTALILDWDYFNSPAKAEELCDKMKQYDIKYYREGTLLPEKPNYFGEGETW
ncbi:MAG: DUF4838 domain-containing protein [Clostridia bacterium]|nr:DUF4838 domain-containing protein [Clostridia bacterium]